VTTRWRDGNRLCLLVNGEQYYPRVFAAVQQARHEVLLETFILFQDKVGRKLREVLIAAARRGVRVEIFVDGFGTSELSQDFVQGLTEAGARLRVFEPAPRLFGLRVNVFRRMHRKLVCVDRRLAFVGGMNFSADHLQSFGPTAKQDYAVQIEGPVVQDIHAFLEAMINSRGARLRRQPLAGFPEHVQVETELIAGEAAVRDTGDEQALEPDADGPMIACSSNAQVAFVIRDNGFHRTDIEKRYRHAMRRAREQVIIANAYFFPGFRFLRDMRRAARRGAEVRLVLQGRPDEPVAMYAARLLYRHLADAGVHIHEYCRSPLHGKVAVVDDDWATVGSSNLDPISLSLNLEANVFIRDRSFARALRAHLVEVMESSCEEVDTNALRSSTIWRALRSAIVFHVLRRFPGWAGLLPAHQPLITQVQAEREAGAAGEAGANGADGEGRRR